MLQKEFFQVQPFNPSPYWDPVIVNLAGAQKFEEDTVFVPGRYKIEVAPGAHWGDDSGVYMTNVIRSISTEENILVPFIVRAYCGSNATQNSIGTNPYVGEFKVNGNTVDTPTHGVDVTHIFGAGGGNSYTRNFYNVGKQRGGGNCLGDGSISGNSDFYAAGSCLHLLPVGGVFGTDYIRAYHFAPYARVCGGAYGGGACWALSGYDDVEWGYRGGNSPYGTGATTPRTAGGGIGGGGQFISGNYVAGGAYFNGSTWQDVPYDPNNSVSSIIRITYLGPLE